MSDDGILMAGGTLQGAQVTTASLAKPLRGNGTVTSAVINSGAVEAQGGTLVLDNTANDWDGVGNAGQLRASGGGTLELRDNAVFGFLGSVTATGGGRVFANNFALDFNPGSSLNLTGSTYESTNTTDLGGAVNIAAGSESTIKVQVNRFLEFESTSVTTLNGNLRLLNNNIRINAGATFSGPGALIISENGHLVADDGADVVVLVDMQGAFRPAGFDQVGRIDMKDYQQSDTGELFVELRGTGLNQFDRLVINGAALLDGYLNIDIDGGFVPALGNTFNILSATAGVSGTFDFYDVSGMPAGLTFHVNYLPTAVTLQVVSTPFFSADFDDGGDVDATDLAIWRGAYDLNQLGDADGDNDTDGADFLLWQRQFGSHPGAAAATGVIQSQTHCCFCFLH